MGPSLCIRITVESGGCACTRNADSMVLENKTISNTPVNVAIK